MVKKENLVIDPVTDAAMIRMYPNGFVVEIHRKTHTGSLSVAVEVSRLGVSIKHFSDLMRKKPRKARTK